jgi:thiamine-phosphate pyrophosphorylase
MDKILRTIDANINRASEGLRVLEDIFRFVLENKTFSEIFKSLRHQLRELSKQSGISGAREVTSDVGKDSFGESEKSRDSVENILSANFKRVQESLRVLEEFFKPVNENSAYLCKKLRFEVYSAEQSFFSIKIKFKNILSNNKPVLYGIIDTRFSRKNHVEICRNLIAGGIEIIQLREKILSDKYVLETAKKLSELCIEHNVIFIVNDRADIAVLCNASGVHLGQDDISVEDAKNLLSPDKICGLSTHSIKQVEKAFEKRPDYIGFGPIYPTKSKENPDPVGGVDNLAEVRKRFPDFPVVAIGGINKSNISNVINCKPHMICVMSGIISSENIVSEIKNYRSIIDDTVGTG